MFSEAKVTEIYCLADDFCKEFTYEIIATKLHFYLNATKEFGKSFNQEGFLKIPFYALYDYLTGEIYFET